MRRVLGIVEIVLIVISIIAVAGKSAHLSLAGVVLIVHGFTLAGLYFLLGYFLMGDNKLKLKENLPAVLVGIVLAIETMGIVFNLFIWPGGSFLLTVGLLGTLIIFGFFLMSRLKIFSFPDVILKKNLIRIVIYGFICLLLFALPAETRARLEYPNSPEEFIKLRAAYESNPENESAQKAYFDYGRKMDSILNNAKLVKTKR